MLEKCLQNADDVERKSGRPTRSGLPLAANLATTSCPPARHRLRLATGKGWKKEEVELAERGPEPAEPPRLSRRSGPVQLTRARPGSSEGVRDAALSSA